MKKCVAVLALCLGSLFSTQIAAFQSFVVQTIRVEGLQRLSKEAVLEAVPVHPGDSLSSSDTQRIIQALFKTGFFEDIVLDQVGHTLIIKVVERPTLASVDVTGIKDKDRILKLLKEQGLVAGRIFDKTLVHQAKKGLEQYYFARGKYSAKIETQITEEPRRRVALKFNIHEGKAAKIRQIKFTGNQKFSEKLLLKEMQLSKSNWLSWLRQDDRYSKEKLAADVEAIRSFYMDHGFINIQIDTPHVSLSDNKQDLYITIALSEGDKYVFGHSDLSGKFVVQKSELQRLVAPLKKGEAFSRKKMIEVQEAIRERLGNDGYYFAEVRPTPEIDENTKSVNVSFYIVPLDRIYVRKVTIAGNAMTKDEVIRRELPQMEATWISSGLLKEGKRNLLRRGYASKIEIETPRVGEARDQVDVIYNIEEAKVGKIEGGIGYSLTEKILFNFSISQQNFLGTGKDVDFTFDKARSFTNYNIGYQDPYFTPEGIGFGANLYYTKSDPSRTAPVAQYNLNTVGGNFHWVFPISKYDYLKFGPGYEANRLHPPLVPSKEFKRLLSEFKSGSPRFKETYLVTAWGRDTLDQAIFPTSGVTQEVAARVAVPGSKLQYYRLSYDMHYFYPLTSRYIVNAGTFLGYGKGYGKTGRYPFFKNFYAGGGNGEAKVRGYEENSLGPQDSLHEALGGNVVVAATLGMIVPNPFLPDVETVRTTLFFDAGQVYDTKKVAQNARGLRYSVGVSIAWNTPLGAPLVFSLAKPLNAKKEKNGKPGEKRRPFTFAIGTHF